MAARSVFKLIGKAYSAKFPLSRENASNGRSVSQPPLTTYNSKSICSSQKSSKSAENLRDQFKNDEIGEAGPNRLYAFPAVTNMSVRDPAREFKEKQLSEDEACEEPLYSYQITDRTAGSDQPFFDVFQKYEEKSEYVKFKNNHLQPCNLRPYGAPQPLHLASNTRKKFKIVYPVGSSGNNEQIQSVHKKHFSTKKECSGYGDTKIAPIYRTNSTKISSKNYSTVSKPTKNQLARKSSSSSQHKQRQRNSNVAEVFFKKNTSGIQDFKKRSYNTLNRSSRCDEYVTVKLGELQEQCRKEKKCKPKKIKFGQLPKLDLSDCRCIDDLPLKEGLPLNRLKKRFDIKEKERFHCVQIEECQRHTRSDDSYQIRKKKLPSIKVMDCPCEERDMTDFVIKRLPKKKFLDPPQNNICNAEDPCVITPRADEHSKIKTKQLPKFKAQNCSQFCPEAILDVPLHRLPKVFIEEPAKKPECTVKEMCDEIQRSDIGKVFKPKPLPSFKLDCICKEPFAPLKDAPPLSRLKKTKYSDPPRKNVCHVDDLCVVSPRADKSLKVVPRKLPIFTPSNCPCVDEDHPTKSFELKRLSFGKETPKEKKKVCPEQIVCIPRADDGLIIKQKKLPTIEVKECPCVEEPLTNTLSLKKLIPKPVKEPIKICEVEECVEEIRADRADKKNKIIKKNLPILPSSKCVCVDPIPMKEAPPLVKLRARPLLTTKHCTEPVKECSTIPRADEFLKVEIKKLPKLIVSECPCIEPSTGTDAKPLERLKKVKIPEPSREIQCAKFDICDETPRADEDDWMYWRKVETKKADCDSSDVSQNSRRSFSTSTKNNNTRRFYSTNFERFDNKIGYLESVDCVAMTVYQNKNLKNSFSKDTISLHYGRSVSTCSATRNQSGNYLQPNQPIIKKKESFIKQYPDEKQIDESIQRSRIYCRTNSEYEKTTGNKPLNECKKEAKKENKHHKEEEVCREFVHETSNKEELTPKTESLWEKVVNFFKARPDCPSPEEFKKMRLKADAEKAAQKAGLCLYDPKELLRKAEKNLPKVITARECVVNK